MQPGVPILTMLIRRTPGQALAILSRRDDQTPQGRGVCPDQSPKEGGDTMTMKMTIKKITRVWTPALVAGLALAALSNTALSSTHGSTAAPVMGVLTTASGASRAAIDANDWGDQLWLAALNGRNDLFLELLEQTPPNADARLLETIELYEKALEQRETTRTEQIDEARTKLAELLEDEPTDFEISEALVSAVTLLEISNDRDAVLAEPLVTRLIDFASKAARRAEDNSDWLMSNELFYRLNALYEEEGYYKKDLNRQNRRLIMIQLYAPERLWELRNERLIAEGEDALPPYNPTGDSFQERLDGIQEFMVRRALQDASSDHVEGVRVGTILIQGLDALETMVGTQDLVAAMPQLANEAAKRRFLAALNREKASLKAMTGRIDPRVPVTSTIRRVLAANEETLRLPPNAILHEFGNGSMAALDDFSAIIWPDELRRFNRNTQGNFIGVGIQIQLDEKRNIKVVTPLEGTPAQRAGILSGDLIKFVNGKPTAGFSLNQAVDQITGPAGTTVTLGIERAIASTDEVADEDAETKFELIEVPIRRSRIEIRTVKGWERDGVREQDWDWFIDDTNNIGYVRLTQFTDNTTRDFLRAVRAMQAEGLNGLILDLRFNPGGLLDEAVSIANAFIPVGEIVSTRSPQGVRADHHRATRSRTYLNDIPVVVLINQGSASASEIVSGAIQDHAVTGDLDAIILGHRSYGKGSVQNVWGLPGGTSAMKLTTRYYYLPGGRMIHRRPGASQWGVDPDFNVDMLPSQQAGAILLRRDADVMPLGADGKALADTDQPDPNTLITDGIDLQLHAALLVLQAKTASFEPRSTVANDSPNR